MRMRRKDLMLPPVKESTSDLQSLCIDTVVGQFLDMAPRPASLVSGPRIVAVDPPKTRTSPSGLLSTYINVFVIDSEDETRIFEIAITERTVGKIVTQGDTGLES